MSLADPSAAVDAFSRDYADAQAKFTVAARAAGAATERATHPRTGPAGEALATDIAWVGPADAAEVLVVPSGTHGVEGFCGSGIQVDWLRAFAAAPGLPDGVAVLLVHALNPYGFAWLRRVDEDGVDLNRNFVDFARPLPDNPGYAALAAALLPPDLEPATLARADATLAEYRAAHGERAYERAVTGGQYTHPEGLFYGGVRASWSRRLVERIIGDFALAGRRAVAVVDLHTGLGPFGYGEPICDHPPGSPAAVRARAWWGESVTEPALGTSTSVAKHGLSDYGWQAMLSEAVTFVALEYGTYPVAAMFDVLRADHWLHQAGEPDWHDPAVAQIKRALRRHFYPATSDWQEMVLFRARQVLRQAVAGLVSDRGSARSGG